MRIAVLKLGARIVFGDKIGTSGGSGEAASIINMLTEAGAHVDCFTKVLAKDFRPKHVTLYDIETYFETAYDYDHLIVINGTVNFFGGAEEPSQILNYKIINNFKGNVTYVYCDPNLQLKQIWPSIEKKPWVSNWKKEDILITRKIDIISQSSNLDKVRATFKDINVGKITQYDFQKFPLMFVPPVILDNTRDVDLMYGGTFRSGRREKKLIEFYFGYPDDLNVEVFGKIKTEDFNPKKINGLRQPNFTSAVNYDKMLRKMSNSKAHIAIGDGHYPEFGMISQRAYESIMSGCLTFIDNDFDRSRKIFGHDKQLSELLYVDNRNQVYDRLKALSENELNNLSGYQLESINFNRKTYCSGILELIKENL